MQSTYDPIRSVNSIGVDGADLAVALLEQSEDCIKMLSTSGHLEFMNCAGLRAMEIDNPAQVLGKLWWELWPDSAQSLVQRNFRQALLGRPCSFEANCPTAKGSDRRWVVSLKPLLAKTGPVVSVLCTSRNVTHEPDAHQL